MTSNKDTAGQAAALGDPVCPRSFLCEQIGFYHLGLFWGITVAAAVDQCQEQQQKHSPWRKVGSYTGISLCVSLLAPCISTSTLLAVCFHFFQLALQRFG